LIEFALMVASGRYKKSRLTDDSLDLSIEFSRSKVKQSIG